MEAGHGSVLVRERLEATGLERPERRILLQRVHEPEVFGDHRRRWAVLRDWLVEQARWHQGERSEANERKQCGERERVAPARIASRIAEEQPRERANGDGEVCGAVEEVPELDEPMSREAEIPGLQPLFEEQPQAPFEIDDVQRVAIRDPVRMARRATGRSEAVPDRGVHDVDRDEVEDLGVDGPALGCGLSLRGDVAHAAAVRGPRPPTAKAGAPRRLTATFSRYSSSPSAIACCVGTPSGVRN